MAFENLDPGDETHRYGDYLYGEAGADVYAGEAVYISGSNSDGDPVFEPVTAGGTDQVAGIAYINATSGDKVTVKVDGSMVARVENDLSSVGGTVGTGSSGNHDAGELATEGSEFLVLQYEQKTDPRDGNDEDYAEVRKL